MQKKSQRGKSLIALDNLGMRQSDQILPALDYTAEEMLTQVEFDLPV